MKYTTVNSAVVANFITMDYVTVDRIEALTAILGKEIDLNEIAQDFSDSILREYKKVNRVSMQSDIISLSENFEALVELLYVVLPKYLGDIHKYKYDSAKTKKVFTKKFITPLVKKIIPILQDLGIKKAPIIQPLRKLTQLELKPERYNEFLQKFVTRLGSPESGYLREIETPEQTILKKMVKIFKQESLTSLDKDARDKAQIKLNKHLDFLTKNSATFSSPVRTAFRGLDYATTLKDTKEAKGNKAQLEKDLFGKENPTKRQIEKLKKSFKPLELRKKRINQVKKEKGRLTHKQKRDLKEINVKLKNDEVYQKLKQWKRTPGEFKNATRRKMELAWEEKGWDIQDTQVVNQFLKENNIDHKIDPRFKGKCKPAEGKAALFDFYTTEGKELNKPPVSKTEMNPKYDPATDDKYYAITYALTGDKSPAWLYTKENRKRKKVGKFDSVAGGQKNIPEVLPKLLDDMKSSDTSAKLAATVIRLGILTSRRVGSKDENETVGLRTLRGVHIKHEGKKVRLVFEGKGKKLDDTQVIDDPDMVKFLKAAKKKNGGNGYIFDDGRGKPVKYGVVNKYCKEHFKVTFHKFRHMLTGQTFSKVFRIAYDPDRTDEEILALFDKQVAKCAKALNDTIPPIKQSYLDPILIEKFFKKHKLRLPTVVKKAMK